MKKIILLAAVLALMGMNASAQNCMVVNSEKIFKSIAAYNDANAKLEAMAKECQSNIDDAYAEVEKMYNDYVKEKPYLSETARTTRENAILDTERNILDYQDKMFGQDGELMKKRVEMIKPIQDKVFGQIDKYAKANGFDLVVDIANNPTIIYYAHTVDRTDAIINIVK